MTAPERLTEARLGDLRRVFRESLRLGGFGDDQERRLNEDMLSIVIRYQAAIAAVDEMPCAAGAADPSENRVRPPEDRRSGGSSPPHGSAAVDALVAEHVCGLTPGQDFGALGDHAFTRTITVEGAEREVYEVSNHEAPVCTACRACGCTACLARPGGAECRVYPPAYSSSIAAAWDVVEAMRRRGFGHRTVRELDGRPMATFFRVLGGGVSNAAWTDAMPEAICLAALTALGVDVPG